MTFTEDLLEFLEATQPETGVDLEEAIANATAQFGARVKANKRVGKKLSPSKYLKKYGASWQNLKNETELKGDDLQEKDNSDWYKSGEKAPPKKMTKKESVQAKKDFVKAAWERKGVTTTKEEVEPLEELKADTYGKYIKRAAWSVGDNAAAVSSQFGQKKFDSDKVNAHQKKELKRHSGISKAVQLLTKKVSEEVEPLEELKATTYGRYIRAASKDIANRTFIAGSKFGRKESKDLTAEKERKRNRGIALAVGKLTNEEVEPLEEISKETAGRAYSARMDKARHHRSLAASTARTLLRPQDNAQVRKDSNLAATHFKKAEKTLWHLVKKMDESVEQVEPIDELSKKTYASYDAKADGNREHHRKQAITHRMDVLRQYIDGKSEASHAAKLKADAHTTIASKRQRGMTRASELMSRKGVSEEVKLSKGTKKDKRPEPVAKALPTMPAGMNAGMRMMPEEVLAEISKDTVYSAYKERYKLADAHATLGNKEEAKKNAIKALKHKDYGDNHDANREKYAKVVAARDTVAKRAKPQKKEASSSVWADAVAQQKRAAEKKSHISSYRLKSSTKVTEETLTEISKKLHDKAKANRAAREAAAEAERRDVEREEWSNMSRAEKRHAMGGEYGGDGRDD